MKNLVKKNILKLKPSATLVINEKSKELINKGKKVYQFGFGQSPFPIPESIINSLKDNAYKNKYLPMQGLEELRSVVAEHLNKINMNIDPDLRKLYAKVHSVGHLLVMDMNRAI